MGKRLERAQSKAILSSSLAATGAALGGPVGGGIGALTGLIVGDRETVFPVDVVCIPAFQAYMIEGSPSMMYYFRAGETVLPTGGNVEDVQEVLDSSNQETVKSPQKKKRKPSAYAKRYGKIFEELSPNYKLKNGKWKKGGFKRCVKAAHKKAGGE